MKKNRRAKKDIDTRIHRMCMMAGTSECEMEELGSTLLEAFHDVCRYMKTMREASEMTGISYNEIRNLALRNEIVYITAGNKRYINMDSLACYLSGDEYHMENIKKLYDGLNEEVEKIRKG